MATKRLSVELMREAIRLYDEHGSVNAAARAVGISRTTLQHRVNMARCAGLDRVGPPDNPVPDPEQKPTFRVQTQMDDHEDYFVAAIGDVHDAPEHPKDRLRWMGRWVADIKPKIVIQIGDFFSFDSLAGVIGNQTLAGKSKPTFLEDIASGVKALQEFDDGLGGYELPKHVTLGNHDGGRIFNFTDRTPEVAGMMQFELDRLLGRFGWTFSPYGIPWFLGGVAFCHVPQSIMGKAVSGEQPSNTIALKATHDWVYGHTHRADAVRKPKLGIQNHVQVINLGCALMQNHVESYASLRGNMTGWWWGVWEIRISGGRIAGHSQITMDELEERYA